MVRLAVENGSITAVSINASKQHQYGRVLDEALFRSKLARLKTCLESERKYWTETHNEIEEPESEEIAEELVELARRPIDEGLVKELEACLTEADKLYTDVQRTRIERRIKQHQRLPAFSP